MSADTCEVYMYVHALTHVKALYTMSLDFTLYIMNVYTKTKVLFMFGSLETVCVELDYHECVH